jgi:hypothetical protein
MIALGVIFVALLVVFSAGLDKWLTASELKTIADGPF